MDLVMTQIKKMSEQVKQAMLSHTPIIYIPTNQIELVQEMLYGENCTDAFIPRLYYDNAKKEVTKAEGYNENMLDNYRGRNFNDKLHVPSLFIAYVSEWKLIMSTIQEFISAYWNIKESNTTTRSPETIDNIRRSAYIVVTPTEEAIPPQFAPYTRTIHIPAISDEEIENIIVEKLKTNEIDDDILGYQLINQMIVCFRGFSANQIGQMLDLMIANQSIDINYVDEEGIKDVIYTTKKQLLASTVGLKWENPSVSGVAGLDNITHWLKDKISIFEDPELARSQHMDIPKGILISGIPGSGKSLMAKTASTLLGMPLISLDMGSLLGGLHGQSEHNMINALAMAEKMAPCVLWIDEIEKAFSGSSQHSSSSDGGVGRRMFGKFLTWMQEKPAACFVFATSNDISCLPPELFRSERFDCKFFSFMPTAQECADIFAANIKAQNKAYQKDLKNMPARMRMLQAKQLFAAALENPAVWLAVINECCSPHPEACVLTDGRTPADDDGDEEDTTSDVYLWGTTSRPKNKLLTGADISALIKEAKLFIHPAPIKQQMPATIYDEPQMISAVRHLMKGQNFKPYGETNLKDIVKCFLKLHENQFVPASGHCILDFECYDDDRHIYLHRPGQEQAWENTYDRVLYYTIVGAINHYAKQAVKELQS